MTLAYRGPFTPKRALGAHATTSGSVDGFGVPEQLRNAEILHPEHPPIDGTTADRQSFTKSYIRQVNSPAFSER